MLQRLREKVEQEKSVPELYDPRRVAYERDMIEEGMLKSELSERAKEKMKITREHNMKYQKYWDKSYTAKLSGIKKYDLKEARERGNQRS
jgi:hypothetical protein